MSKTIKKYTPKVSDKVEPKKPQGNTYQTENKKSLDRDKKK